MTSHTCKIGRATLVAVALASALGVSAVAAKAPVDLVSNPNKLNFVGASTDLKATQNPSGQAGGLMALDRLTAVKPGASAQEVQAALGAPLRQSDGPLGKEWDYEMKVVLQPSKDHMVCQYKVVLDDKTQTVRETAWRRRQCLNVYTASVGSNVKTATSPESTESTRSQAR